MKRIILWMVMATITTSVFAWDAPTPLDPKASDFVVGKSYYFRNVGCGQYLAAGNNWATQASFTTKGLVDRVNEPLKIKIESGSAIMSDVAVTGYKLYLDGVFASYGTPTRSYPNSVGNTYIFRDTETDAFVDWNNQEKGYIWTIVKADNGYYRFTTVADDPSFTTTGQFAGWDGTAIAANSVGASTNAVRFNLTEADANASIDWELIDGDECDIQKYNARLRLYNTLQEADAASVSTTTAGAVYTNEDATLEEIDSAYRTLAFEVFRTGWATDEVTLENLTPAPDSLVSGKYYYLYNVDAQMFFGRRINDYSYSSLRNYVNERILITKQSNGYYTMQYSDNSYYIDNMGSNTYNSNSSINSYSYWRFVDAGNGYFYIQRNYNYNSSQYLGWTSSDTYLNSSKSLDLNNNIRWQLIAADDEALAMAQRMMLYKAIETSGNTDWWQNYVPMLTDGAQTATSLYSAAYEINKTIEQKKTDAPTASWNELAMSFWSDDTWWRSTNNNVAEYRSNTSSYNTDGIMSLSARVSINEASKLLFDTYSEGERPVLNLWVDGNVVKSLNSSQLYNEWSRYTRSSPYEARENTEQATSWYSTTRGYRRYIVDLPEGQHTLEWRYTDSERSGYFVYLQNIAILPAPTTIKVSYSDAGSLGTEVLRQVNNVNDVRRLKITGPMNDDDWARIAMMTRLVALDLSDAQIISFPAKKFDNYTTENWPFLHELKLPKTLQSIGDYCFRDSYIEHIDIPESVTSIGSHAFYHSQIHEANVSSHVSSFGDAVFARCYFLEDVTYQPTIDYVPTYTFMYDNIMNPFELPSFIENVHYRAFDLCNRFNTTLPASLKTIEYGGFGQNFMLDSQLPESLTAVDQLAFYHCYKLNSKLPASLKTIGISAFEQTALDSINIPEGVTSVGNYAFANCGNLEYAELPASYANIASGYLFSGSTALKTLKIKSPTLLGGNTSTFVNGVDKGQITLQVPDYLVTAYKLDDYWYNFGGFEGFSTEEVKDWVIQYPLTLSQHDRFLGSPNVDVKTVNFIIQGQTGMELNDFSMDSSNGTSGYSASTQIMSSSNDISINGDLSLDYYTTAKRWFFLSLPFDIRVGDLETTMQYAIAYYDGASRAANNSASGNWKDYTANDIIPAGTGFIYQTNAEGWTRFKALDTSSKNRAFAARDISLDLTEHPAESSANTGWNLVGNPWMTYFNNHSIDFTAPFTIWNPSNSTYTAYSLIDDDYALRPNQAIFVQCPEGTNSITFPARGRQLTSVIENQNGVKAQVAQNRERRIIDLTLTANEQTDQTRIVMNPQAAIGYEMNCDASKFFTIERAPQLYSLDDDGTAYAINERPMEDGTVRLAFVAPSEGTYTISMPRCQTSYAMLQDKETGESTDLSQGDYTFYSGNGTYTNRLELFVKDIPTGIEGPVDQQHAAIRLAEGGIQADIEAEVYGLDGRLLKSGKGFLRMPNGAYIVRVGTSKVKVVVK